MVTKLAAAVGVIPDTKPVKVAFCDASKVKVSAPPDLNFICWLVLENICKSSAASNCIDAFSFVAFKNLISETPLVDFTKFNVVADELELPIVTSPAKVAPVLLNCKKVESLAWFVKKILLALSDNCLSINEDMWFTLVVELWYIL